MEKKFSSDELPLAQLLDQAASGELQLPDFQRGWVWDDGHIRSLLASISLSYSDRCGHDARRRQSRRQFQGAAARRGEIGAETGARKCCCSTASSG